MELRSCSNTHLIQDIGGSLVNKVCNKDSNRGQALSSKTSKDVYQGKNAKILQPPPKISPHMQAGLVFDYEHVKCEVQCLPVVDGTLCETKPETDEFVWHPDNGPASVLDAVTTSKELTKKFLKKRRKFSQSDYNCEVSCSPVEDGTLQEIKPEADEFVWHPDSGLNDDITLKQLKETKKRKSSHSYENCEVPGLLTVDRTLRETKSEMDEFVRHSYNNSDSDLDDETTLKQLKERFLEKIRNFSCSDENSNLECVNEKAVDDESKLSESIINWQLKKSRRSRGKRRFMKESGVSSLITAFDIKSEPNLVSEHSLLVGGDLTPNIRVKVEAWDSKELGCQRKPSFADDSYISHNEVPSPVGEASIGLQKTTVQLEPKEPLLYAEECLKCVTNEISYDHLEDTEPIPVIDPSNAMSFKLETSELHCHEFLDLPPLAIHKGKETPEAHSCGNSPSDGQNSDHHMLSRNLSSMEEIHDQQSSPVVRIPDVAIDCTTGCAGLHPEFDGVQFEDKSVADFPCKQHNSLIIPGKNLSTSHNFVSLLKADDNLVSVEDNIAEEEEPLAGTLKDIDKNGLSCRSNMEDELLNTAEKELKSPITDAKCQSSPEKQTSDRTDTISVEAEPLKTEEASTSPITNAETQSSPKYQTSDSAETILTPESCRPPERLCLTRKVISPSSQEQLCLAINSVELSNGIDKCRQGQVSRSKVFVSSRSIIKQPQSSKVNFEGPRFPQTTSNLSTGCMSLQGCSEGAIAFSRRQMQDIESLAVKMMNELKSMKDIVEQKLLQEAYSNFSLRGDADEVKSVVDSAKKMEETAQRWLSRMTRDCNRFCKIMELTPLTPNGVTTSKDASPRQRRKIMFADEAGGRLCHVKFFETAAESDGVRQ